MGSREDDDYWNTKYAEASCHDHGSEYMWYDSMSGEWKCDRCIDESYDDGEAEDEEALITMMEIIDG